MFVCIRASVGAVYFAFLSTICMSMLVIITLQSVVRICMDL